MSGGTVDFKKKCWVRNAERLVFSILEGKEFLKKYYKGGILSTGSAQTYISLLRKQ